MKAIILALTIVSAVIAEPPVPSNRYLPSSRTISRVSTQYGTPLLRNGNGNGNGFGSVALSTQYGAPFARNGNGNGNGFGSVGLSSQYNAPSSQYGAPSVSNDLPSAQYGAPSSQYGAPSSRYGAPGYSRSYDDQSEPANYNFQYDVQEPAYGNDFGHAEARQGDNAQGRYYVLLPDGRKQTVEYTADLEGYKPRISYEQTNNVYAGRGGYGNGGYSNGGYSNGGGHSNGGGYNNGAQSSGGGYSNGNSGNGGYQY